MKIELNSKREIVLKKIYQEKTYMGLLAGYPNSMINRAYMERAYTYAKKSMLAESITTIAPKIKKIELDERARKRYRNPESLPAYCCIAEFWSNGLNSDDNGYTSILHIIWYQDEFALPMDDAILTEIKLLDWEVLAVNLEF